MGLGLGQQLCADGLTVSVSLSYLGLGDGLLLLPLLGTHLLDSSARKNLASSAFVYLFAQENPVKHCALRPLFSQDDQEVFASCFAVVMNWRVVTLC